MALLTAPENGHEASDPYHIHNGDLERIRRDIRGCKMPYFDQILLTAIHMFQQDSGLILMGLINLLNLSKCDCGCDYCCTNAGAFSISSCIDVGNFEMLAPLLQHRNVLDDATYPSEDVCGTIFDSFKWEHLFLYGSRFFVEKMLDTGLMRPSRMENCLPLNEALKHYRQDLVRLLFVRGVNVNTCDDQGNSLLQLAVERGRALDVQLLLDKGANPASAKRPRDEDYEECYDLCKAALLVHEAAEVTPGSKMDATKSCKP